MQNLPSARLAAKLRGERVQVLDMLTEASTTWANPDGTLTTETSAGPVRFRRDGVWVDIDVAFARRPDGSVASKAHPGGLRLAGPGGGDRAKSFAGSASSQPQDLITIGAGVQAVALQWKGGLPEPKLDGAKATYPDALPGADLVVEATRTGFEQFLVLNKRPETGSSFTLPLRAQGVNVAKQADGSVLFTDKATGRELATMPAPRMWDATVDPRTGEHTRTVPVGLEVAQTGSNIELRLTPDETFLADPATVFPVTVDPSSGTLSDVFDTWVQQGQTADQSTHTELKIGWPGDYANPPTNTQPRVARSFVTWNMAPIKNAIVSSATLKLFNFHSWDCTQARAWEVWDTNTSSTATRWTAQPNWLQKFASSTETRGTNCNNGGWVSADVTSLLQYWAGQTSVVNQGMGIRATNEADTYAWKRFYSGNAAASQIPKIEVTYNYRPRTGTDLQAGPPFFSYNGEYVVNTLTPTLRDTFVDADNDQVDGTFQIFDAATNTQVGDVVVSPYAPSGQPVSAVVPAGVLQNGKTYKFRSSPYDGTHYNDGWSAWKTFTVDTSAPSAPGAISSADYPSNAWVKGIGQTGTFTVPPPTADHHWLEWTLDGATWTKVPTNGANTPVALQITPTKGGTQTLQVRAVDKADNKSEPVSYTFHVGAGGITGFDDGERTAARLPLTAEAETPKFDAVTFSWRRSDADAWAPIPPADIVNGGQPLTTWPVALANGASPNLVWNATTTVNPDGPVQLKADFTGPHNATGASDPLKAVVDRTADGAASQDVGPGKVNLLTGDLTLSGTDASVFGMTVTRTASSRTPDAGTKREGQAAIFGKEWVSGTVAELTDSSYSALTKTSETAVSIALADGSALGFTANQGGTGWIPETGAESLTLTGSFAAGFTLSDTDGVVTTFAKADPAATVWTVTSSLADGLANSTTKVVSETIATAQGVKLARPKRIISSTSAVTLAACETNPATKGCRVLEFVYANTTTATASTLGDFAGQVAQIKLWATDPGVAAATATDVTRYTYDNTGRLREVWDPRISPELKTTYTYDTAGRVTTLTPPGQLPWTFTYGQAGGSAAAGDGMLLSVSRPTLTPGTATQINGTAATSLVYGVPAGGTAAPYDLGPAATAAWGQTGTPADATAVFPADQVPANNNGSALPASAYGRATVTYLDASGRRINTALPGGHITTTDYDKFGNTVRELTAANRALAIGVGPEEQATLAALGIAGLPSGERARLLSTTRVYNADGTRELEELGPLHQVTLTSILGDGSQTVAGAGTAIAARERTIKEYDTGRPTDGTAKVRNQVTKETVGAQPRANTALLGDARVTGTGYDWAKGLPTSTTQNPGGLNVTTTTAYDDQGRITKTTLPKSNGTDAGATITTYWTGNGTGPCSGRPEWADSVCQTGPAGTITGGGTNPTELPTKTSEYGRYGQTTKIVEAANGTTRSTTTDHDSAARPTTVTVTGGLGAAVPVTATGYDPASGLPTTTNSPTAGTITRAYDALGRLISYTDADGGTTTTAYDVLNRPTTVTDSVPSSTTYTYATAIEPRGLVTSTFDSIAGTFTARYNPDGTATSGALPGGYTMRQTLDSTGRPQTRAYTRNSDNTVVLNDTITESVHGQWTTHAAAPGQNSSQAYAYDATGRLTQTQDTANGVCTTRAYTFDNNTNRTGQSSAAAGPGADCTTSGGTTITHSYDSADRLTDSGYAYDAFGRSAAQPGGLATAYYSNDLVRQQIAGTKRQTWSLDAALRFRSWTTETADAGTWSQTGNKVNHYGADGDNPRWVVEDITTGDLTRNVTSPMGDLGATTGKAGGTALQLTNLHGDVVVTLPLDSTQPPLVLDFDEYGNVKTGAPGRYGWLGGKQRSAETPTGNIMMGVRLYSPPVGRFLTVDPIPGGNATAYDYVRADPFTQFDLDGKRCWKWARKACNVAKSAGRKTMYYASYPIQWAAYGISFTVLTNIGIRGGFALGGPFGAFFGGVAGVAAWYYVSGRYTRPFFSSWRSRWR
ncbi:DNRLRE domain-containing protein [Embleya sp. NPDC008237]|uniref:DNRLRE domain-containing protein n=1 Tax=Embleya sp. NPDC008237 TaxID=3363978 RepID=UPI0036F14D6B